MERKLITDVTSLANSLHSPIDIQEIDRQFDDAFIEDADQNSTPLERSSEAVIDKSVMMLNNSSSAADCLDILHRPLKGRNNVNSSESSSENFCIWEIASITPKSTDKTFCESANQDILMEYSTKTLSPTGLKDSPSSESIETKNCIVKLRDIFQPCVDSPSKKTGSFSSSLGSLACGQIINSNIRQCQPLKSDLEAESDTVNTDNHSKGKRNLNSFHEKKLPIERARLVKKRAWKHNDVPRKRKYLGLSIAPLVPPVSLKNSPSRILLDSHEGLITDKDFLLTRATLPNSNTAQSLPLNSPLETVIDIVNTDSQTKNKRRVRPYSENKILTESMKEVNVFQRKRQRMGRLVDETLAGGQSMSENEIAKLPLNYEDIQTSSEENISIHNEQLKKMDQNNDVLYDDVIASWTVPPASDENLELISCNLASSKSDSGKQNCLWEVYSGEKLFSLPYTNIVLANAGAGLSSDENAALANELKNWKPFSACAFSETVGAVRVDTELAVQENVASDTRLASTELLDDQLQPAKKKKGRKSMSADREIASQMVENTSPQKSDFSQAFPHKRYPQRRRSTALLQFAQNEACSDVPEASMTFPVKGSHSDPNMLKAGSEFEIHLGSEPYVNIDETKLGFENTVKSGDELTLDLDASILDTDFNLYTVPAKCSRRLRRKSTELYRLSRNNSHPLLASVEEMSEQQETTASQKAQNELVNVDSKRQQNGINKSSNCLKQKKGKAEKGPPLEDIYLNRLWRSQMPKEVSWETIPEDPKYNKETGGLRLFSVRKAKRFLDFEEGPSLLRLKSRKLKAKKLGWKPLTKKKETALSKLLMQKLSQLDEELGVGRELV